MLTRCTAVGALLTLTGSLAAAWVHFPTAPSAPTPKASSAMPQLDCVRGFSKDYCNGNVTDLTATSSGCFDSSCKTVRVTGTYGVNMVSNRLACGSATTYCDEAPDGFLKIASSFTIRLQPNCPYRGCWEGEGVYRLADGTEYSGTLMGTVGVGTHRAGGITTCSVNPGTRNCERCYDVSFNSTTSIWRLGYEASFHGTRADTGEEVCFSLSGDFFIPGDNGGPKWDTGDGWTVAGTADGIWLTFCPF